MSGLVSNLHLNRQLQKVQEMFRIHLSDLDEYIGGDATHDFEVRTREAAPPAARLEQ